MAEIRLYVCCHQPTKVPEHPLLIPIQVGTALADSRFPGFLHDDVGENISYLNRSYCELTAQYWAWKNAEAEYFGFFHYRRYLFPNLTEKLPYRIAQEPTLPLLDKLGFASFASLIPKYDLIIPKGEDMHISVREHYSSAPHHREKDLALIEQIIRERHPEMTWALEQYLSNSLCYFGNIYIMRRDVFRAYCGWLFPLLEEFDRQVDTAGYSPQEKRVDGYLAERLLGVYVTFWRHELKVLELPRVHFCSGPEYVKRRVLNLLLPPGSRRRSLLKGLKNGRIQGR